jgi:hypothetical protein
MSALDRCPMHGLPLDFATDDIGRSIWNCSSCRKLGLTFRSIPTPVSTHRQCADCRGAIIGKTVSIRCLPCRQDYKRETQRNQPARARMRH